MFDIGFWELALIGVIALLVVGPDRLPAMARQAGLWVGRIRRYVSHVKDDIEREIRAEELREMMKESSRIESLDQELSETRDALKEVEQEIDQAEASLGRDSVPEDKPKSAIDAAASGVADSISGDKAPAPESDEAPEDAGRDGGSEKDERRSG